MVDALVGRETGVEGRVFTKEELSRQNGVAGVPALVAVRGRVYDLSGSFLWQRGNHQGLHFAGCDLTDALADAPHGADFLERFPVVGTMAEGE